MSSDVSSFGQTCSATAEENTSKLDLLLAEVYILQTSLALSQQLKHQGIRNEAFLNSEIPNETKVCLFILYM